jgi:hypothetical protein
LPDGQPDRAGAEALRDLREAAHAVTGQPPDRADDADIDEAILLLWMHADMAVPLLRPWRCQSLIRNTQERAPEHLFRLGEKAVEAPGVEHVF